MAMENRSRNGPQKSNMCSLQWKHHDDMCVQMLSLTIRPAMSTTLTHWGRVTHMCVGKLTNLGSDNGLSPGRREAIIWTIAGIMLIWHLGTNFSEIIIEIHTFSFKKIDLKMSSGKWQPSCPGLNVLISIIIRCCLVNPNRHNARPSIYRKMNLKDMGKPTNLQQNVAISLRGSGRAYTN